MKRIAYLIITALFTFGLSACGANAEKSADTAAKVRVATQPGVYAANILLAKVNGYFEEELKGTGVEVTWDSFASGPPMNEAFAGGQEDIGLIGDVPLLTAKASGQKTTAFAKLSSGEETVALTVEAGSDISDVSQLKGKKVAFVKGSYGHHFLGLALAKGGLTLDDVEQVNLPNADIGNAVASKQVDAGVIWEPGLSSNLANGTVKIILDGTGIKSNNVFFFTTEDFAEKNPEILKAFIRALERANKEIKDNPQQAAELLKDEISLSADTLVELFGKYQFSAYISDSDINELKEVEKFNREQKFSEQQVNVDEFVDRSLLNELNVSE